MGFTPSGVGQPVGYARVSTTEQSLEVQVEMLREAGIPENVIFQEKVSGNSRENRAELKRCLSYLRSGDILTVTRIDRLARSQVDLVNILEELRRRGVHIRCLEQPVDTTKIEGRAFFGMLAVFAEFETAIRRERQAEGIAKAKKEGRYAGRKISVDRAQVRRMFAAGIAKAKIARELGCDRRTVIRILGERHEGPFVRPRDIAEARDALSSVNDVLTVNPKSR